MEESTHFIFNKKGVFISPNILPIINFLQEIDKEIESLLSFSNRLTKIAEHHLEMVDFVKFLSEKLAENNIDFEYQFKQNPENIAEKFEYYLPLRSVMIILFASLEVLFTLNTAYESEIQDAEKLRELTIDSEHTKKFLNAYLLCDDNDFYKANKSRLIKIDARKLRDLRNSLNHFFSIGHGGLSIAPEFLNTRSRKFENLLKADKKGHVVFLSEEDLYGLIKSAKILRMRRWSSDFEDGPENFKRKMDCAIQVVKREGAIILQNKNLNLKSN